MLIEDREEYVIVIPEKESYLYNANWYSNRKSLSLTRDFLAASRWSQLSEVQSYYSTVKDFLYNQANEISVFLDDVDEYHYNGREHFPKMEIRRVTSKYCVKTTNLAQN